MPVAGKSLSRRTIEALEADGYIAENVEQYNCFSKRKHDLFNVFDILGVGNGHTVAVQVTSRSNISTRVKKIKAAEEVLAACREANWRIEVWGWDKGSNGRFRVKVVDLS